MMIAMIIMFTGCTTETTVEVNLPVERYAVFFYLYGGWDYVSNAEIRIVSTADNRISHTATSDEYGRATIFDVRLGSYHVTITAQDYEVFEDIINVTLLNFEFHPYLNPILVTGWIWVRVPGWNDISNAEVTLVNTEDSDIFFTEMTDWHGDARFRSIPKGVYTLTVSAEGYHEHSESMNIQEHFNRSVWLTPHGS
jgi:hypothetical protein